MRDIKFRAWVTDCKGDKMVDFLELSNHLTHNIKINFNNNKDCEHVSTLTKSIMQYTGLKDKNGVEIYEGDIVSGYSEFAEESFEKYKVLWNEEDAKFSVVDGGDDWYSIEENIVVIGNIYEHPELLEIES